MAQDVINKIISHSVFLAALSTAMRGILLVSLGVSHNIEKCVEAFVAQHANEVLLVVITFMVVTHMC